MAEKLFSMVEKEKGFNPAFENGGCWEYYKELEH
jgi:hypothetical protein